MRGGDMEKGTFEQGYIAGWQSVRGDVPVNVPPSPMRVTSGAYMVGVSRGMRDASEMNGGVATSTKPASPT
jgi:hypothetical protein